MGYKFDVYLAHAWEDKPVVELIATELRTEGFRVWYDDDQLQSGKSLRQQLDEGMQLSQVGVVVLSRNFFTARKVWAPREFDVWLDAGPQNRLILVWLDVDKPEVAAWSPIAGTLFARRYNDPSFLVRLSSDVRAKMIDSGLYAAHLRSTLTKNLDWVRPPEFFDGSLTMIENNPTWVHTDAPPPPRILPVDLQDLFAAPSDYQVVPVAVAGFGDTVQLLDRSEGVQEFALCLTTRTPGFENKHLQVVIAKIADRELPLPEPPSSAYKTLLFGWVVGRGGVHAGNHVAHTVLFFATNVVFFDVTGEPSIVAWEGSDDHSVP